MKTKISFIIGLFLICNSVYSQYIDVKDYITTPNGSGVETWICQELSSSEIDYLTNIWKSRYPNAVKKADATRTYNCHGYAWSITENTGTRWINRPFNRLYIRDGSFLEVEPDNNSSFKIDYSSDDHSAVATTSQNIVISKWGQGPLMQHSYDYCPYNSSSIHYLARAQYIDIVGSNVIQYNEEATFSLRYSPIGTFNWSVSGPLQILSGQGTNSIRVKSTGTGEATLSVNDGKYFQKSKQIRIGVPDADKIEVVFGINNTLYSLHTDRNECRASYKGAGEILEYEWSSVDWEVAVSKDSKNSYVLLKAKNPPVSTMSNIKVRARNSVGWSNERLFRCNVNNDWSTYSILSNGDGIVTLTKSEFNTPMQIMKNNNYVNYKLIRQIDGIELCSGTVDRDGGMLDFSAYGTGLYLLHIYEMTGENIQTLKFIIR